MRQSYTLSPTEQAGVRYGSEEHQHIAHILNFVNLATNNSPFFIMKEELLQSLHNSEYILGSLVSQGLTCHRYFF